MRLKSPSSSTAGEMFSYMRMNSASETWPSPESSSTAKKLFVTSLGGQFGSPRSTRSSPKGSKRWRMRSVVISTPSAHGRPASRQSMWKTRRTIANRFGGMAPSRIATINSSKLSVPPPSSSNICTSARQSSSLTEMPNSRKPQRSSSAS